MCLLLALFVLLLCKPVLNTFSNRMPPRIKGKDASEKEEFSKQGTEAP